MKLLSCHTDLGAAALQVSYNFYLLKETRDVQVFSEEMIELRYKHRDGVNKTENLRENVAVRKKYFQNSVASIQTIAHKTPVWFM